MSGINQATILGRATKAPELKHTPSGHAVASFSVATSKKIKDQEKTEFHNIVVWGKLAELCAKYIKKGDWTFLQGEIQTESYEKDGQKRYSTKINAQNVQFLGQKSNQDGAEQSSGVQQEQEFNISAKPEYTSDDIPF